MTFCGRDTGIMVTGPDSLYVTLLILLHSLTSESVKFEVLGPTDSIVAVAGDDIILPCYLKPNISVKNMTVDWQNLNFIDKHVYRYQNGKIIQEDQIRSYRGRTSLFKEELWRGNTSLKLTRVQGSDEGLYECLIKSNDWYDDIKIQVFVNAVGFRPLVSFEGHREGGMGLVCQSKGWHPEPDLVWLDSNGVSLSAGPPEIHRDIKGFYTVKQHVIVQKTDTNLFTCRVLQRHINEEVETEVHIPSALLDNTTPCWGCIGLSCFLVVPMIGFALTVYWIHKKKDDLLKKFDNLSTEKDDLLKEKDDLVKEKDDLLNKFDDLLKEKDYLRYVFDTIRRHAVDVTLDPDTAHPTLILSEDGKQVRRGDITPRLPDNPERFDYYPRVLGKEGFSVKFYFEVQVKDNNTWTVGVARKSVNRKENFTETPNNGYWTVVLCYGDYKANTEPRTLLPLRKPQNVGVFVDYEEGQVSFFNVETRVPRFIAREIMAGVLKKTTGLVGLAVSNNPRERLRILYSKILTALQVIPQDAAYRKYTEQLVNERFDLVKTELDVEKLEKKINSGQIEEVIHQAECELALSRKMADWKPWEPLIEEPPVNQWKWPV
ncbi:hypothetical protein DPEC_G00110610 [Dallia pectoralis]|uniref:Uncharacterized protein n=1 Tax=Dallia pectoralis TaxID=75939 RepID=A0ACC2GTA8_DALPE|nr:hypothetical protein DPEC_G00110610 [Dallia pectoralis]